MNYEEHFTQIASGYFTCKHCGLVVDNGYWHMYDYHINYLIIDEI